MKGTKLRIGVLTVPLDNASVVPLSNLVEILFDISEKFVLITGNAGYNKFQKEHRFKVYGINYKIDNTFLKILRYSFGQIKTSLIILKFSKKISKWVFYEGEYEILPIIIAKLLNKKVYILLLGSTVRNLTLAHDPYRNIVKLSSKIILKLSDNIIMYSPTLIENWNLQDYKYKALIAHEHFLDFNTFKRIIPLPNRPPLIGFIGRLSEEKGVLQFVQTLPVFFSNMKDLRVLIGGDGQLKETIEIFIQKEKYLDRVDLPGWISHDELPYYLNQLRLLVIPSYTEGLPNIMLEAMACGTPVLATPVGMIPDIIIDDETGFLMENNSQECIGENVIRALNSPDLETIAENGRKFVLMEFSFEKTKEQWKKILQKCL